MSAVAVIWVTMVRTKVDVIHDSISELNTEAAEEVAFATMVLSPQTDGLKLHKSVCEIVYSLTGRSNEQKNLKKA